MNMITKKIKHGSIVGFGGKTWFRFVNGGGEVNVPSFQGEAGWMRTTLHFDL